jgi:hypothetical protein
MDVAVSENGPAGKKDGRWKMNILKTGRRKNFLLYNRS